jgi:serine/threonine protein kinase
MVDKKVLESPHSPAIKIQAKISDFGLMYQERNDVQHTLWHQSDMKGTYSWMAPELFVPKPFYSFYSDVYAFSMIIFEMLEEIHPWKDDNSFMIMTNVKQGQRPILSIKMSDKLLIGLEQIMKDCWKQEPKDRPKTEEIVLRLERLNK